VVPGHSPAQQWWWGKGSSSGPPAAGDTFCQLGYGIDINTSQSCFSGFELTYISYALGRAYELGFPTDKLIANVVGPWYVAEVTDPGYNPYLLGSGRIPTQKWSGNAYFSSMADLLTGYSATQADCASDGCYEWRTVSTFPLSDAQNGYDVLGSAAIAMTSPLTTGGAAAWAWVQPRVEASSIYNDNPVWAILPRGLSSSSGGIYGGGKLTIGGGVRR
jgi:hypothetical protein